MDNSPAQHNEPRITTTPLTPTFNAFTVEVQRLLATWTVWHRLFADDDSSSARPVLDRHPEVWNIVYYSLIRDVLLGLCRLTDRTTMGQRQNLTVEAVLAEMESLPDRPNLMGTINAARGSFEKHVMIDSVRNMRNRVLAHNDCAAMVGAEIHSVETESIRLGVAWLATFQWRCESLLNGRLVDWSASVSAVHRDRSLERELAAEVDSLLAQLGA